MKLKNVLEKVKHFKLKKGWISLESGESTDLPDGVLDIEKGLEKVEPEVHPNYTCGEDMSADLIDEKPKEEDKIEEFERLKEDGLSDAEARGTIWSEEMPEQLVFEKPIQKHTKTFLKNLSKKEQTDLLKQYGLSDEEIKYLKKEEQRIEKLLELQDEN